ncbi:glycoside hydrolase [Ascobolus immersus RN42]|uniref:glucan endo-1,3-beta-D-glucosidase n=1 Tax=Ascobolus immersus RN42 TaxID=1160509 RepID=A0A3N4ICR6_ASCIM|nr:glycoside hydrolase [Ascobolus immersus RN42]
MSQALRRQFSWELEERTPSPAAPEVAKSAAEEASRPGNEEVSVVGNKAHGASQPVDSNFRYDPGNSPPNLLPTKSLLSQNSNINALSPPTKGHPLVHQNPRSAPLRPENVPIISPGALTTAAGTQPLKATSFAAPGANLSSNTADTMSRPQYAGDNNYSVGGASSDWDHDNVDGNGPHNNVPANLNAAQPLRPHDSYSEHLQYYVNPNAPTQPDGRALTPQPSPTPNSQLLAGANASSLSLGGQSDYDHAPPTPAHIYNHHNNSSQRVIGDAYANSPYNRNSTGWDPALSSRLGVDGSVDFVDDDDYIAPSSRGGIGMVTSPGSQLDGSSNGKLAAGASKPGIAAAGGSAYNLMGSTGNLEEKENRRRMREKEAAARKRRLKWIIIIIGLITLAAAAGGITGGILQQLKKDENSKRKNGNALAREDDAKELLDKDSKEIKALMANDKLHKVFHGIDYTPLNTAQYPDCINVPASQNNVTRDIAVLSQLTNKIRLYGNDCNQTELVMTAIERLEVDMKVWVGVWIDDNEETNKRQIDELWNILDKHDPKLIEGIAVGNEVLFREEKTIEELIDIIKDVRAGLKKRNITGIPIGSSDLGSAWREDLAESVDVLMANIHPFFGHTTAAEAADWTIAFFERENVPIANRAKNKPRVMISEVGWPSGGGTHEPDKGGRAVAGVKELQTFLDDFICQQNEKGLEYYWFSAFDEPWKVIFNKPDEGKYSEEWEDKWGLMDVNRVLKPGITIPDCK